MPSNNAPILACGDALDYPGTGSGASAARLHTHVIVKIGDADVYLIPISSEQANLDNTCVIKPGCGWSKIVKDSFVAYYHAKKVPKVGLESNIRAGIISYLGQIPPGVFDCIVAGIGTSPDSEPWFVRAVCPPPPRRILEAQN